MRQDKIEAVTVNGGGLKCDTPDCDWSNPGISMANYAAYVGYNCPKCSAVVLTQDDYEALQAVLTLIHEINAIAESLPEETVRDLLGASPTDHPEHVSVKVTCEDGEVTVHEPKPRTN
jgi:hypothetical protein